MKYQYLGVAMMSFLSGLILSYVYFSMHNLRADVAEVSQMKERLMKQAAAEVSKSSRMMASVESTERKLKSPKFSDDLPLRLKMWADAELKVEWTPVAGASAYNVLIESKSGKRVRKFKTKKTSLTLHNLPLPEDEDIGDYNVRLAAVNGADEAGELSEPRSLAVQRDRGPRPPTIKSIEVLD